MLNYLKFLGLLMLARITIASLYCEKTPSIKDEGCNCTRISFIQEQVYCKNYTENLYDLNIRYKFLSNYTHFYLGLILQPNLPTATNLMFLRTNLMNKILQLIASIPCRPSNARLAYGFSINFSGTNIATIAKDFFQVENSNLCSISDNYPGAFMERLPYPMAMEILNIDLSKNQIRNIKKDLFKNMLLLQTLDLSKNNITHFEPNTFQNLRSLKKLQLSHNQLTNIKARLFHGSVSLFSLEKLDLGYNNIETIGQKTFTSISSTIKNLDLSNNQITDIEIGVFKELVSLRELNLSYNGIKSLLSDIFTMNSNLTVLNLGHNQLFEITSRFISNIVNLEVFIATGNKISTLEPEVFSSIDSKIRIIDLSSNSIDFKDKKGFSSFARCKKLTKLNLSYNNIQAVKASWFFFPENNKLQDLDLSHNSITHIMKGIDGFSTFSSCKNLTKLNLSFNNIGKSDKFWFDLAKEYKLQDLDLSHNKITEIVLTEDFEYKTNFSIDLSHNKIKKILLPRSDNKKLLPKNLKDLKINKNPLVCNDDFYYLLDKGIISDASEIVCHGPRVITEYELHLPKLSRKTRKSAVKGKSLRRRPAKKIQIKQKRIARKKSENKIKFSREKMRKRNHITQQ